MFDTVTRAFPDVIMPFRKPSSGFVDMHNLSLTGSHNLLWLKSKVGYETSLCAGIGIMLVRRLTRR